jgi:hypothetical protein
MIKLIRVTPTSKFSDEVNVDKFSIYQNYCKSIERKIVY